jgi:biotin carboxyl carrier protein
LGKHRIVIEGQSFEVDVISKTAHGAEVRVNGVRYQVELPVSSSASVARESPAPKPAAKPRLRANENELRAPMAGRVIAFRAKPGSTVRAGEALLVLDAMKMENTIGAPGNGRLEAFDVALGDTVLQGALLARLSPT